MVRQKIKEILNKAEISDAEISVPEHGLQGHYSTNVALRLAKSSGKKPVEFANELAEKIKSTAPEGFFEKVEVAPPGFINFWISLNALQKEFGGFYKKIKSCGKSHDFPHDSFFATKKETVIVEYSQPNIAKKMHVGHLRTTIVGDALANVLESLGHKVIRWNYLGDWGTQFGKLITAYKLWGDKKAVEADPINELQKLYVRFHDELKNPTSAGLDLDKNGQREFKKLEDGDRENRELWEWFKKESLKEFEKTYETLGVRFDMDIGESFYEKDIKPLIERLQEIGVAKESEGALVIPLDQYGLPPALIRKSDGASLYLTRDIANLEYRIQKYKPEKILYVVGNEQSLHFQQLFAVADILGFGDGVELAHIKYGLVLGEEGKKLATREGKAVLLGDVLEKVLALAKKTVDEKRGDLSETDRREIAEAIGVGSLKYGILKENNNTDITFNWERMLDFTGDSAPYLQYTHARFRSVARKAPKQNWWWPLSPKADFSKLTGEIELRLIRKIMEFPEEVLRSGETLETNNIATYLYELASLSSRLYETTPVLKEEDEKRRNALLALIDAGAIVLKSGLGLLGTETPERI